MRRLRHACIAASLLTAGTAVADSLEHAGLGSGVFLSSDSEGFVTRRAAAEVLFGGRSAAFQPGLRMRFHDFDQGNWNRKAQQLLFTGSGKDDAGAGNWQGEIGVLQQHGKQLLTMDATAHLSLSKKASAEFFINRDYVETAAALDQGIHATYAGASMEVALHPHLTGVALIGRQSFSDGNDRNHGRLRLIYQPDLDLGLTLQWRYRFYDSASSEVRRAYFNPEHYRESMLLAGWRKRGEGWTGTVLAGIGRQNVGEEGSSPTRLLESSVEKSLGANQSLSIRAGYNQSASFGGPDYRYRYLQANWSVRF